MVSSEAIRLLHGPERRVLLREMVDRDGDACIDELAATLATQLEGRSAADIEIRLYHVDLPKLAQADVIEYDWADGDLVLTERADRIQPLLEFVEEHRAR